MAEPSDNHAENEQEAGVGAADPWWRKGLMARITALTAFLGLYSVIDAVIDTGHVLRNTVFLLIGFIGFEIALDVVKVARTWPPKAKISAEAIVLLVAVGLAFIVRHPASGPVTEADGTIGGRTGLPTTSTSGPLYPTATSAVVTTPPAPKTTAPCLFQAHAIQPGTSVTLHRWGHIDAYDPSATGYHTDAESMTTCGGTVQFTDVPGEGPRLNFLGASITARPATTVAECSGSAYDGYVDHQTPDEYICGPNYEHTIGIALQLHDISHADDPTDPRVTVVFLGAFDVKSS